MAELISTGSAAPTTPAAGKATSYIAPTTLEPHVLMAGGVDINLAPIRKYNYVRNSGMWFAQRQAPGTLTTYSSIGGRAITADGWGVSNENASVQYDRVDTNVTPETDLVGRFYGRWTKITANGKLVLSQVIEGSDAAALRGGVVRIQFWAKMFAAFPFQFLRFGIAQLTSAGTIDTVPSGAGLFITAFGAAGTDPTLGANLAYIVPKAGVESDGGTIGGSAITAIMPPDVWRRLGGVFEVPLGAKNLVLMVWSSDVISTGTGIALSQCSITDGQAIQDWAPESISLELRRVQRFYCKSFNVDTLPAQNAGLIGTFRGHVSVAGAIAAQPIGIRYPVPTRTTPTFTFFNPSAANAFARNTTAGTDATATASANAGDQGADVTFTGIAAWTVAQAMAVHFTADAEL